MLQNPHTPPLKILQSLKRVYRRNQYLQKTPYVSFAQATIKTATVFEGRKQTFFSLLRRSKTAVAMHDTSSFVKI